LCQAASHRLTVRVASLVSGGKDSIYASLLALEQGWDVTHYVTIHPRGDNPYLYHRPNVQWVELQARCAGVPHVRVDAEEGDEAEQTALRRALEDLPIDGVTSGALASEYQRTRIDRVCDALGHCGTMTRRST
jgi:diphthine-ammonia ligase